MFRLRASSRFFDPPPRPAVRPNATTCCFLSSLKTLPIPNGGPYSFPSVSTSRLLRVVIGFQVSINGRFWMSIEG
jgi:hypothetical protein